MSLILSDFRLPRFVRCGFLFLNTYVGNAGVDLETLQTTFGANWSLATAGREQIHTGIASQRFPSADCRVMQSFLSSAADVSMTTAADTQLEVSGIRSASPSPPARPPAASGGPFHDTRCHLNYPSLAERQTGCERWVTIPVYNL